MLNKSKGGTSRGRGRHNELRDGVVIEVWSIPERKKKDPNLKRDWGRAKDKNNTQMIKQGTNISIKA